jgi:hypothetical protein
VSTHMGFNGAHIARCSLPDFRHSIGNAGAETAPLRTHVYARK